MTDEELQKLKDQIVFPEPKDTETVVNVPLYIPKIVFENQMYIAYAISKGYKRKIQQKDDNGKVVLGDDKKPVMIDNPESPMLFVASGIRGQVRLDFERFVKTNAIRTAQQQADLALKGIFDA